MYTKWEFWIIRISFSLIFSILYCLHKRKYI